MKFFEKTILCFPLNKISLMNLDNQWPLAFHNSNLSDQNTISQYSNSKVLLGDLSTHFSAYHFKDNSAADVRATANDNVGNFCYYVVPRNSNHADGITLNL